MTGWGLWGSAGALLGATAVLVVAGPRLAKVVDQIADRTGLGQAIAGGIFLGGATSLTGIVTTVTGAVQGDAGFALANPIGGVAIQSAWLAIADLVYRRSNLEHAAASIENLTQALILVALLMVPVVAYATPQFVWGWVHPASLLIPALYGYGLIVLRRVRDQPMWSPRRTSDTDIEEPHPDEGPSTARLWLGFGALAAIVGGTGWVIGQAGLQLVAATGWPSDVTGFTVTTAISSLPELITLIAAVRLGSPVLAVGNIVGGNVFDTLMIAIADVAYTDGTIYQAAGPSSLVLLGGTALITTVLAGGLLVREQRGIGFEGFAIPVIYLGTVGLAITAV